MFQILRVFRKCIWLYGFSLALVGSVDCASAKPFKTLYEFAGGSDGATPVSDLIADQSGNLYGTAEIWGDGSDGIVFKLAAGHVLTVLHAFGGGSDDGAYPFDGLISNRNGDLFGTTSEGGVHDSGTVFKLANDGAETVLYSFAGATDGETPYAGVIADKNGDLFGTTSGGGATGSGTIFKVTPAGVETVLYSFMSGSDGSNPYAGLIADKRGNLYGTTVNGGASGFGTVFKVAPNGSETVLHSFNGSSDGANPYARLLLGRNGDLYGTAYGGGTGGYGTVF